jgi:hypothetical protein
MVRRLRRLPASACSRQRGEAWEDRRRQVSLTGVRPATARPAGQPLTSSASGSGSAAQAPSHCQGLFRVVQHQ